MKKLVYLLLLLFPYKGISQIDLSIQAVSEIHEKFIVPKRNYMIICDSTDIVFFIGFNDKGVSILQSSLASRLHLSFNYFDVLKEYYGPTIWRNDTTKLIISIEFPALNGQGGSEYIYYNWNLKDSILRVDYSNSYKISTSDVVYTDSTYIILPFCSKAFDEIKYNNEVLKCYWGSIPKDVLKKNKKKIKYIVKNFKRSIEEEKDEIYRKKLLLIYNEFMKSITK